MPHPMFEKHQTLLQQAVAAIEGRGYWSPYAEGPRAYGETAIEDGRKAFEAKSQASLIAAIMGGEPPPVSKVQPMVPPAMDRLVKTCLAKDPDERWQTAHDVKLHLQWIAEGGSQAGHLLVCVAASPITRHPNPAGL